MPLTAGEAHELLLEHYGAAAVEAEPTWASVMVDVIRASGHDDRTSVLAALAHLDTYLPTPADPSAHRGSHRG